MLRVLLCVLLLPTAPRGALRAPPTGFMDLRRVSPTMKFSIAYHTRNNFTGAPLPGYGAPGAWLRTRAARALAAVHRELAGAGLGLLIFDAYRPRRATLAMLAWARRSGNWWQVKKGYISATSSHNRGAAVDLGLFWLKTGKPLDMGTPFDSMGPGSRTLNVRGAPLKHRLQLKRAMERHGFVNFAGEWWHFNYPALRRSRARDVPLSCFEPAEGVWRAPRGWTAPSWRPPLRIVVRPCLRGVR